MFIWSKISSAIYKDPFLHAILKLSQKLSNTLDRPYMDVYMFMYKKRKRKRQRKRKRKRKRKRQKQRDKGLIKINQTLFVFHIHPATVFVLIRLRFWVLSVTFYVLEIRTRM